MLAHVGRQLPKLGKVLNESTNVFQSANILVVGRFLLKLLHQSLDGNAQLSKVLVHVVAIERILHKSNQKPNQNLIFFLFAHLRGGENELGLVFFSLLFGQQHAIVRDPNKLVHHRAIGPLRQQRRDRIILVEEKILRINN